MFRYGLNSLVFEKKRFSKILINTVKDVISCPWAIFYVPKMNKIVNWESRINSQDLINKEYLTEVVVLKYETSREAIYDCKWKEKRATPAKRAN